VASDKPGKGFPSEVAQGIVRKPSQKWSKNEAIRTVAGNSGSSLQSARDTDKTRNAHYQAS